jgi:hypothetical protein
MSNPKVLDQALDEARRALGSEQDVQRLRAKLGELTPTAAPAAAPAKTTALASKVVIGTTVAVLMLAAAIVLMTRAPSTPPSAITPHAVQPLPVPVPEAAAPAPPPVVQPRVEVAPEPKPAAPRRKAIAPAAAPPPTAAPAPPAPKELELLTAAQDAIDRAPQRALGLLEEHARFYPNGSFAQERESLAIDALRKLGRTSAAQERARAFVVRFPKASSTKHLQTWLDDSSATDHKQETQPLPTR